MIKPKNHKIKTTKKNTMNSEHRFKSQKGTVMIMALVLSAVTIMVAAAVMVVLTSGTQITGQHARYKDSRQAAKGCADVFMQLIETRGDVNQIASFGGNVGSNFKYNLRTPAACTYNNAGGGPPYTAFQAKVMADSTTWINCDANPAIDPNNVNTYDMDAVLGRFSCYAKLISTTQGNSGPPSRFRTEGVVMQGSGGQAGYIAYLYGIEVFTQQIGKDNAERSRLSILYQY